MAPKAVPSCVACRLRRVGCVREDDDILGPCIQCRRKGISCVTPDKNSKKPYKRRDGHRVQAARELCGSDEGFRTEPWLVAANDQVARIEESDAFLASLVDTYYELVFFAAPSARWKVLRKQFDLAGRRPSQLKDSTANILIKSVMAYGALVSACPALVGKDAPSLTQLLDCRGSDLSLYGKRRLPIARRLFDQAVTSVDMQGVFRKSCDGSVSILTFIAELTSFFCNDVSQMAPYLNAASVMLKEAAIRRNGYSPFASARNLDPDTPSEAGGSGVTVAIMDALYSATSGVEPGISDQQAPWFIGLVEVFDNGPPLTVQGIQQMVNSEVEMKLSLPACILCYRVFALLRRIGRQVAHPIIWKKIFPTEAMHNVLDEVDELQSWLDVSEEALRTSPLTGTFEECLDQQDDLTMTTQVAAGRAAVENMTRLIERHVDRFKSTLKNREHAPVPDEIILKQQIKRFEERLSVNLLDAARTVARRAAKQSSLDIIRIDSSLGLMGDHVAYWAKILLDLPCDAQGGVLNWTLADKIQEVTHIIGLLKTKAWCWPGRAKEAREIEGLLLAFKDLWQPWSPTAFPFDLASSPFASPQYPAPFSSGSLGNFTPPLVSAATTFSLPAVPLLRSQQYHPFDLPSFSDTPLWHEDPTTDPALVAMFEYLRQTNL